jgi:glycine dehydrogenase subunit 1
LTVKEINRKLLQHHVHGGKDVSKEFPELGQTALYCTTEIHTKEDIDRLAQVLEEILRGR